MWHSAHHLLGRKQRRLQALNRQSWGACGLLAGPLLAVCGGAAAVAYLSFRRLAASDHLPGIVLQANDDFGYDLVKTEPGQSPFFTYPVNSSERSRLLLNRDSAGVVRATFASSTTCYFFRRQHDLLSKGGELICGQWQDPMRIATGTNG